MDKWTQLVIKCLMLQDMMLVWYTTTLETITVSDECMTLIKIALANYITKNGHDGYINL